MACRAAKYDPDSGRYDCDVLGGGCLYLTPNSKQCARDFNEGPDAQIKTELERG